MHKALGPGLLESVYEECLCHEFDLRGLEFRRQVALPISYKSLKIEPGYRIDIVVAGQLIVEVKTVESILPVHEAQLLTYMRLSGIGKGLIMNFHVPVLKDGLKRMVL